MNTSRYARIDHIRAAAVLSMVLYHALWDLVYLYGLHLPWYRGIPGFLWQQSICWTFILLSGFCHSMSKNPRKAAMRVFLAGLLVSAVTWIFTPDIKISFGVLTLLGSSGLLLWVLSPALSRLSPAVGLGLGTALFALTRNVNSGYLGFWGMRILELPRALYANWFTSFLGFPFPRFSSSDYFSLFPWFFLFLCGYCLNRLFREKECLKLLQGRDVPLMRRISRHSLLIYLLHQPLLSVLFSLIF